MNKQIQQFTTATNHTSGVNRAIWTASQKSKIAATWMAFAVLASTAFAQVSSTWTGSVNSNWATSGNWTAGTPGAGALYDTASFTDTIGGVSAAKSITVDGLFKLNQLNITAGQRQTLTLTDGGVAGRGLEFGSSGALLNLANDSSLIIDTNVSFLVPSTITAVQSSMTFNAGKTFQIGTNDLVFDAQRNSSSINVLSAIVGTTASITKDGAGTLRLSGANTFSGGVNFNAGKIQIGNDRAFGTGALTIGDGVNPTETVSLELLSLNQTIDNRLVWKNDLNIANSVSLTAKTINFTYAGAVDLDGLRRLDVADLSKVVFGPDLKFTGNGGIELTGASRAEVMFLNGESTYTGGYTQWLKEVTIGSGAGNITLGGLASGQNYLGTGSVFVSGSGHTLFLNPGAASTSTLKGNITLDWGAIFDPMSGSVVLDGATLAFGANGAGSRFVFRGNTTFTNASFSNNPDLYFNTLSNITIDGTGMGAGANRMILENTGTVTLAAGAQNVGASQLRIEKGTLVLGADDQIRAGTALYMNADTFLRTGGYSATFSGGLSWSGTGSRIIDLNTSGASTLTFGAGSAGGSGLVYMQYWTEGTNHLLFADNISSASWRNNIKFDGYNWALGSTVVPSGTNFELMPALGTPAAPGVYEWTGQASYSPGGGSGTNVWNAPGNWDINRFPSFAAGTTMVYGDKYNTYTPSITLPGTVTVGNINFKRTSSTYNTAYITSGTLIMDSGTVGVASQINKSYYDAGTIASAMQLNSNLVLNRTDSSAPSGSYYRTLSGKISDGANGASSVTVNGGAWYLGNTANDFSGGITLNGGMLRLINSSTNSSMGKGELTLNGGILWGGAIYNKVNFTNDFTISQNGSSYGTAFYGTGNPDNDTIWLNRDITINGLWNSSSGFGIWSYLYFYEGRNLRGTGGLTFTGQWDGLLTNAYDSDFSGGFTQRGGIMNANATLAAATGNMVFGEVSARENYLGIGNITLAGGSINLSAKGSTNRIEFRNGVVVTGSSGTLSASNAPVYFLGNSTLRLYSSGYFNSSSDVILSDMNLIGPGSGYLTSGILTVGRNLVVGNARLSQQPNITMSGASSVLAESGTTALTGLGQFSRSTALTTTTIDTSISQIGATQFNIASGRLKLSRDNQITGTANLILGSSAIISSAGYKNTFGNLTINGASTMELGTNGELSFNSLGSWSTSGVISLLNIQNDSGIWNTDTNQALGSEHVWFNVNPFLANDVRLANIAFTGYTRGAAIIANGGKYELVTSGEKGFEWSGGGVADTNWDTPSNWYGNVPPDSTGAIAIFRDADDKISNKIIRLNGNRTVGKIFFEGTTDASFTIAPSVAGQTLTFANSGSQSLIYFGGVSYPTVSANIVLSETAGLLVDHQSYGRTLALSGIISGPGGIKFTVSPSVLSSSNNEGYYLTLSGSNTFTGGVEQQGGYLSLSHNSALGTGTYTVTGTATVNANGTRIVRNALKLDGGLKTQGSDLTFKGNTGEITSGTKTLTIYSGNLIFDSDYVLTGSGGLNVYSNSMPYSAYYALVLRGQNTFAGGVDLNYGSVVIGASSQVSGGNVVSGPLGTGTYTFNYGFTGIENPAVNYVIHNPLVMDAQSNSIYLGYLSTTLLAGSLTFDSITDLKLRAGTNTFYAMGVPVVFTNSITNPDSGVASLTLATYSSYPAFLRLTGSNSFTGGISLNPGSTGSSYMTTLSIGNNNALGTGTLTLNNYQSTIEAYGADRDVKNLVYFNNPSYITYFTATNGAQQLTFSGSGSSRLSSSTSGTITMSINSPMIVTFGTSHNLINGSLTKIGTGELQLLGPRSTFLNLNVNAGTVYTSILEGRDMVLNGSASGNQDSYFGTGVLNVSGVGAIARINTLNSGGSTGDVYLKGNLTVSNNGLLEIVGGGNLYLGTQQTVSGVNGGSIAIRDGGWMIKEGNNTTSTLNAAIIAPIAVRSGTLSLATANLLANASKLELAGGLLLNGYSQSLNGNLSLLGDSIVDIGVNTSLKKFTVNDLDTWNSSALMRILNWDGYQTVGGGNAQILINNYTGSTQYFSNVWFDGYAPGGLLLNKGGNTWELVAYAQTFKWIGRSTSDWTVGTNWSEFVAPNGLGASASFGDDALISTTGSNIVLNNEITLGSIIFNGTRNQTFNISSSGASQTFTFDFPQEIRDGGAAATITMINNSDANISADMHLKVDLLINNVVGADLNLSGQIYDSGTAHKVTKSGDGQLTLSGNQNTFSGGMELAGGLLRINANEVLVDGYISEGPLGKGDFILSGGTITAVGTARTASNRIVMRGDFGVTGGNTVTFGYDPTKIAGGQKSVIEGTSVTAKIDAGSRLIVAAENTLSGTGRLVKDGAGTLVLSGSNENSGGVNIAAGTLQMGHNNALGTGTLGFTGNSLLDLTTDVTSINNAVALSTNVTGTIATTTSSTLTGAISGAGSLTKAGSGTLTITASNSYSGTTNVTTGVVVATDADSLGASTINIASTGRAEFVFNSGTLDNQFAGTGAALFTGTDVRIDANNSAYSGTWTIANGASVLVNDTADLGSGKVALTGTLTADGANNYTFNNVLTGSGDLVFAATGTNNFGSAVGTAFTGNVSSNAGTLVWDSNASRALTSSTLSVNGGMVTVSSGSQSAKTLVANGGTFAFTGTAFVTDFNAASGSVLFDSAVLNQGNLLVQDEGTVNTLVKSTNSWSGALANLALVDALGAQVGTTSTITLQDGAAKGIYSNTLGRSGNDLTLGYQLNELQLQLGRTGTLTGDVGTGAAADMKAAITGAGSLEIAASRAITLVGQKAYTGTTYITSGTLQGNVADVIISSTAVAISNGGVFALNGNAQTLNDLSGVAGAAVQLGSSPLTIQSSNDTEYAGTITGSGAVAKNGAATLTLSGTNNYAGGTQLNAGTLHATNVNALGGATNASSTVAITTGTLDFDLTTANSGTYAGTLTGAGAFAKNGSGTLTMSGNSGSWTGNADINTGVFNVAGKFGAGGVTGGTTTIHNGAILQGTGTLNNVVVNGGGHIAPGNSPGRITIDGNLNLQHGAILDYELGMTTNSGHIDRTTTNDLMHVTGNVDLSGTTTLNIDMGSAAFILGEYDLVKYNGALTGSGTIGIGSVAGSAVVPSDIDMLSVNTTRYATGADKWITLFYGVSSRYVTWDGGSFANWTNTTVDGGNGYWYSPNDATNPAYTAWVDPSGTPNGLWDDGGFAIFNGTTSGTVTVVNNGNEIDFSGLQIRRSGYLITGGTLTTSGTTFAYVDLRADAGVTGTIETVITGTHSIRKTDAGTLVLAGTNTYDGSTTVNGGVLVMSNTGAISSGTVIIDNGATLRVATDDIDFANKLTGSGTLEVDLMTELATFAFATTSGTDFAGTAVLKKSTFTLESESLVNAGLRLEDGNTTTVATGTHNVRDLAVDGGTMVFRHTGGQTSTGMINTGSFAAISGTVSVTANTTGTTGLLSKPLLQQDEGMAVKLVGATSVSGSNLTLAGGATTTADIKNASSVTTATATYNQALAYANLGNASEQGLYVSYELTELGLVANQTTTLTDDAASAGAAELHAKISGAGNLGIAAVGTGTITLNNSNNSYTGTTTVSQGALLLGANNVLGSTSDLVVNAGAIVDVNGKTQTITKQTIVNGLLDARAANSAITTGTLSIATVGTTGTAIFENNATLNAQTILVGAGSSTKGTLLVGGSAVVTSAGNLSSPPQNLANGYISVYDHGTVSVGGRLSVGGALNSTGSMSITDNGYVQYGSFQVGGASGAKGLVLITQSGSLIGSSTSIAQLGAGNASASGTLNISDSGLFQVGWLTVGQAGKGVLTAGGNSSIVSESASVGVVNVFGTPGSGTVTLNDQAFWNTGTLTVGDAGNGYVTIKNSGSLNTTSLMTIANAASGTGVLTIQDDALVSTGSITFGAGTGTLNLDGGMLQTAQINGSTTGVVNFNSGTLQATASGSNFIAGFTTGTGLHIAAGGAYIDTNGYAVGVNADSAFDGSGKLTKLGSGTLTLSASSSYTGGTEINEGTVVMTYVNAIGTGTGNLHSGAELRVLTNADTTFVNALEGTGLLSVDLSGTAKSFNFDGATAAATGANFTGMVSVANTTINLGSAAAHNNNAIALANSTLELINGAVLRTNSETRTIGGLDMDQNSVVHFDMNGIVPNQRLHTGTLTVNNSSRVAFSGFTGTAMSTSDMPKNFLDQDEAGENATILIATGTLITPDKVIDLVQDDGVTPVIPAQVIDYGAVLATYNYAGVTVDENKAHSASLVDGPGLYYDYLLTQLDVKSGQTLVLSSTDAVDTSKNLAVLVTGSGNVDLVAGAGGVITLSHSNNYLGETTVMSGTAIAGDDSAFGHTSLITINGGAAMDLVTYSQTGTALNVENGGLLNINAGALTLSAGGTIAGDGALAGTTAAQLASAGYLDVTGNNSAFAGSVANTGTIRMVNVSGLGDSGTLANGAADAVLRLDAASGTLAKSLGGEGTVELLNSATVALSGSNTSFSGTFGIEADSRLLASLDEQLGEANLAGEGVFEKIGAGTNITIDHANMDFTGTAMVTGGTLTLTDLLGTGTGSMVNNAALVLADSGSYANALSGSGTTIVRDATVAITSADNTGFEGLWQIASTGTASITDNAQLGGDDAAVDISLGGELSTSATTFVHALSGSGVLAVNSGTIFDFMGDKVAGGATQFDGTVVLENSSMTLGTNKNTEVLTTASVQLDAGSVLHANDEATKIAGLAFNGGALSINMNGAEPVEVLKVGTLSVLNEAGSAVIFENYNTGTISPANVGKNFLDQDELTDNATLLVEADTLAEATSRRIDIRKADGSALENGQVIDYGNVLATYNYTAQTTGSASAYTGTAGLYYDYLLTQLDVQAGQVLNLTTDGATDNQLLADIVGAGDVVYTSGSSIILSGSNTYTGTSTIASGTVVATRDHVLGETSSLVISSSGAFSLDGNEQTVGTINTAAGSLINLGTGSFSVTTGGTIAGSLSGASEGTFAVTGGTVSITGSSTGFAASTTIAPAAAIRLVETSGLGTSAISIEGILQVDNTVSGIMANTLSGSGQFTKTNTGTVTLINSSTGFVGTAGITSGKVIATKLDALGSVGIDIASAGTYELSGVTGTLANTLSGSGTFGVTGSKLTISNSNSVINTVLAASEVTLNNVNALSGTAGIVTMDQSSKITLGVNNIALGTLNLNGGLLAFGNARDVASIAKLGDNAGLIYMNVNLAALQEGVIPGGLIGNYLTIDNAGSGSHGVYVNTGSTQPAAQNTSVELITAASGSANFTLANPGHKLEYNMSVFELLKGDGTAIMPTTNTWYLTDNGLSHAADAIISTASVQGMDWAYSLDSLHQRMGEVRSENLDEQASHDTGNIWVRTRASRLNASNDLSGMAFDQYMYGVTAGGDKSFAAGHGVNLLGGFIDMGKVDREFDNHGSGDTNNVGVGVYFTMLHHDGWFADLVARYDRYKQSFEAKAVDQQVTKGDYTNQSQGLSAEFGRRFQRRDGWWVEPILQASIVWINGAEYDTTPDARRIHVEVSDSMSTQYRAQMRFGKEIAGSKWQPYGKIAAVTVDSDPAEVTALGKSYSADYDGKRIEFGFGTSYRINASSQMYLDYEYAKASNYERPWAVNLGYRKLW